MLRQLSYILLLSMLGKLVAGWAHVSLDCFQCLCEVSIGNDEASRCTSSDWNCMETDVECGPYALTKRYWLASGSPTQPGSYGTPKQTWTGCASDLRCAQQVVGTFLGREIRDCNDDGKIDCDDFVLLHSNPYVTGEYRCDTMDEGRVERYDKCKSQFNHPP